jgi:hypothetical protein
MIIKMIPEGYREKKKKYIYIFGNHSTILNSKRADGREGEGKR